MKRRLVSATLVLGFLVTTSTALSAPKPGSTRILTDDLPRRIDINRVNMFVTNLGGFGFDANQGSAGLYYPRGASTSALFAGGLWLGLTSDPPRLAVAEYSSEFAPGRIVVPGGGSEPDDGRLVVYKMKRWTGDPADSMHVEHSPAEIAADPTMDPIVHHSWSEYMTGAVPFGAPVRMYALPVTSTPSPLDTVVVQGPDVVGDQMLWSVFNDGDPMRHSNDGGSTAPIGVQVQSTVFGFDRRGPLGDVVFIRYQITNRQLAGLDSLIAGLWADPDLGGFLDDLTGSDFGRNMGYVYNSDRDDTIYGNTPPALGLRLLSAPIAGSVSYTNGQEPRNAFETLNYLKGLEIDGSSLVDPVTTAMTPFEFPGDPVTGEGWLDPTPADKRVLISRSAVSLLPDSTLEILVAVVAGRGGNHVRSISELRCNADFAAESYASGFVQLDPAPDAPPCPTPVVCPRPLIFWQDQCAGGGMPEGHLELIAQQADAQSAFFDWSPGATAMCGALQSPANDVRSEAEHQYASLLANVMASRFGLPDPDGKHITLSPLTSVSCPGIPGTTVADLIRTGSRAPSLFSVAYGNLNPTHATALSGIDFGLPQFGGGAGVAYDFLGSSLNPAAQPDSFATVHVRFGATQKAYRYLRLERASDGAAPPQGRGWIYAGFHDVPFDVHDMVRDVGLDAAFVERVLTADDGTILPSFLQPATFDSTWGPDASDLGGREYLFLYRKAYTGFPDPLFQVDGQINGEALPALYVLASKRSFEGAVIDPGDLMFFQWGQADVQSIDQMLIDLESQPLSDPGVQTAYANIASCIENLNSRCDVSTPVLASLVQATASPDAVELAWYAPELSAASIHRSTGGAWSSVAEVTADGRGMIAWADRSVTPGERYGYRLVAPDGAVHGETWIETPSTHRLSLAGTQPNPSTGEARVMLSLKRRSAARLEVMDVAGRRVARHDLSGLGPGAQVVRVPELDRLPAGIYLMRLTQDRETAVARMVRIR